MTNKELFAKTYAETFKECYPQFDVTKTQHLIEKAIAAACENIKAVDINGAAFKATFKKLGVKHTYTAIQKWLAE